MKQTNKQTNEGFKMITFQKALEYVAYVVDDSLNVSSYTGQDLPEKTVLVGYQCGFEPLFVAVYSYLDCEIDEQDAEEIASDYLQEKNWFSEGKEDCDYIIRRK